MLVDGGRGSRVADAGLVAGRSDVQCAFPPIRGDIRGGRHLLRCRSAAFPPTRFYPLSHYLVVDVLNAHSVRLNLETRPCLDPSGSHVTVSASDCTVSLMGTYGE